MLVVRVPPEGVILFQQYESRVLPLLAEHGGRLERRLRGNEGTVEVHIVWFPAPEDFARYRADARRAECQHLLEASGATSELIEMGDVDADTAS